MNDNKTYIFFGKLFLLLIFALVWTFITALMWLTGPPPTFPMVGVAVTAFLSFIAGYLWGKEIK